MFYELAKMRIKFGTTASAATAVEAFTSDAQAKGKLLGAWFSDIGALNELVILRGFATIDDLMTERRRVQLSANPFGCADFLETLSFESFEGFSFVPEPAPGNYGAIYELRTYEFKTGGQGPTQALWEEYLPARQEISKCVVAMAAIDGAPRFTQLWPYDSVNDRSAKRAEAVQKGIWPPKGGPANLQTNMVSQILMPLAISPLK